MKLTTHLLKLALCAIAASHSAFSSGAETAAAQRPAIRIPKAPAPPRLADYLSNSAPQGLRITGFIQREPNDGEAAALETIAYLSYDETNLYAVFLCKEDRRILRAHIGR